MFTYNRKIRNYKRMTTSQLITLSIFYFISVLPYIKALNKKEQTEDVIGLTIISFIFTTTIYVLFAFIFAEFTLLKNETNIECPEYQKIENVYKLKETK